MKYYCLNFIFLILLSFNSNAQIEITSATVATTTNASEGDFYLTTDTNEFYVGLASGLLKALGNVTATGTTSGDILTWNTTTNKWDATVNNSTNNWFLTGNTGTVAATNFLGTTDNKDLVFRTNNIEKLRLFGAKRQVLVNQANTFKNHPLVIRANGDDVLAFQDNTGVTQWHWNLRNSGLNFAETDVLDGRLFLQDGGNVGISTEAPTERLHINGGTIRIVNGTQAAGRVLTSDANGVATWQAAGANNTAWALTGNTGTDAAINFLGTTDNKDLVFRTNNIESGRISVFQQSTLFGYGGSAAFQATAIGREASADANLSVALGFQANATAQNSIAIGNSSNPTGNDGIAIGRTSKALLNATVVGGLAEGNANNATVYGYQAKVNSSAQNSTAIGTNASVSVNGQDSNAFGYNARVNAAGFVTNANAFGTNAEATTSNTLILGNNANVGIGTSTPSEKLHVTGSVRIVDGTEGDKKILTSDPNGKATWELPTTPALLVAATRTNSYTITSSFSTLNYDTASINIGTAYNTGNGQFTAPADGLYQVIVSNMYLSNLSNDNSVKLRIIANGVVDMEVATEQGPYSRGDTPSSIFATTYVQLNAGQNISVEVGDETGIMLSLTDTAQHVLKIIRMN